MDQVKIGIFIAKCRREKDLTQRQLADKIGVSDKAVSKWECGNGLPEAGCMIPLCDALGISVNELLSGERIPETEYQEKAEDNMVALSEWKAQMNKQNQNWKWDTAKKGIGFGSALAMVLSFHMHTSVFYAILHGLLGWLYVIYYLIKY